MRILAFAVVSLAAGVACGAEVYRSVDANGIVKFSDRPEERAERIVVVTAGAAAAVRPQPRAERPEAAGTERVAVDGGEVERQPTAAERAGERARNCQIATERAERYRSSRRLYRELPNGEREYLDDAELESARADAQADVSNWCD
jgi:hypothetical protein